MHIVLEAVLLKLRKYTLSANSGLLHFFALLNILQHYLAFIALFLTMDCD